MPTPPPARGCARRSSTATPAPCRTCRRRSRPPTASPTACVAPANTRRPPRTPSTACPRIPTWPRCAAWRATRSTGTVDPSVADCLEAFLQEVVHHLFGAFGRQRVVDATRRALGVRQRKAVHGVAEVHELPVGAGGVHFF